MNMKKIVVLGSCVTDVVARMDRFPNAGETVVGNSFNTFLGGKGANQCVSIARLHGEVKMIGKVGEDLFGDNFINFFEKENIDTNDIYRSEVATGVGNVQIDSSGQNRICIILGANLDFSLNDLRNVEEVISNRDILLTQFEMDEQVTMEAIKLAKEHGLITIVNPAPARVIKEEYLPYIDYLIPNEFELSILANSSTKTSDECLLASKKLYDKGVKNIITTWGDKGAILYSKDKKAHVSSYKVNAIDTVGAGDSFNGAFAYAIANNVEIINAIKFANAMGALTTTKNGAIPSIHTLEEVKKFIKNHDELIVSYVKED